MDFDQKSTAMPGTEAKETKATAPKVTGPVSYMSKKRFFTIRIRHSYRLRVGGKSEFVKGKRATFSEYELTTIDPEIIETLDGLLVGNNAHRWRRLFTRTPGQQAQKVIAKAAQEAAKVEEKIMSKDLTEGERQELSSFNKFIKEQKVGHTQKSQGVHMGG